MDPHPLSTQNQPLPPVNDTNPHNVFRPREKAHRLHTRRVSDLVAKHADLMDGFSAFLEHGFLADIMDKSMSSLCNDFIITIVAFLQLLDSSFNGFRGPGFEPLEACKALQVLAASNNRLEENPIVEMPHVEPVSISLVGPTLKKLNDRDLSSIEITFAKHYPANTSLCIAKG
ncbi:hypothetical protein L2E82_12616 [Cichorium intybus]|uniref:Uncharacterized protein n=1 Tax=Cichorium intybus TaxID=13427 RepID=A0ACB9GGL1_CICIN|nr:hypothetical protein L2E82_12616 [Cichorium intybus]